MRKEKKVKGEYSGSLWEYIDRELTAVMPPMMAMKTEAIAEMTASMARPIAEIIPPCYQ